MTGMVSRKTKASVKNLQHITVARKGVSVILYATRLNDPFDTIGISLLSTLT